MITNNKETRIIISFLILFFSFLYFFITILDFGVKSNTLDQTGKVNLVMKHDMDPNIVIFGSSVSEVGISPHIIEKITNRSCYNFSISGTRFKQYKCLIDEFNEYSKSNEIVVLVETYFSFEPIDMISEIDFYLAHINNENIYNALYSLDPDLIWKARYVPFYKFIPMSHKYYKNSVIGWIQYFKYISSLDSLKGYTPQNRNWELDADLALKKVGQFKIKIENEIVARYELEIKQLKNKGKKVFIVLTPMFNEKLRNVTDISPLVNRLKQISNNTNATFIDFSQSLICKSKSNFYNSIHLNLKGSEMFSEHLGDSINYYLSKN